MAVRNTNLPNGSTNWSNGNVLTHTDLNDTFDAGSNKIKSLSAFWLDSYLYTVYDNFDSYSVGAWVDNTLWTGIVGGSATNASRSISVVSSTIAGGSSKEIAIVASVTGGNAAADTHAQFSSVTMPLNKHFFLRGKVVTSYTGASGGVGYYCSASLDNSTYYNIADLSSQDDGSNSAFFMVFVQAVGSGTYNLYSGGKLLGTYSTTVPNVRIRSGMASGASGTGSVTVYIDDARYSTYNA